MSDRAAPFVAYINPTSSAWHRERTEHCKRDGCYEAVVTPLLEGDPRPGETWLEYGREVTIVSAPFPFSSGRRGVAIHRADRVTSFAYVDALRRPPVLKTYRLNGYTSTSPYPQHATIEAESKEAALAKLAEALEEIVP